MNAVQYALNDLRFRIPAELLKEAFQPTEYMQYANPFHTNNGFNSIEANIRQQVIDARVNVDCGLKGALEVPIDLQSCHRVDHNVNVRVYTIPTELLGGRPLVSVKSVSYTSTGSTMLPHQQRSSGNMLVNATLDLYRAIASLPISGTARCHIIGPNTVVVQDNAIINSYNMYMMVNVGHDDNMESLNQGIFPLYATMVEHAVKSYIFNTLTIPVGQDFLRGGFQLGRFKEILDGYADSEEMYQTIFREQWGKAQFTNDPNRKHNFIKSMFARG